HYLTFTLAVIASAWYGGWGPGLLATAVGFLASDYFFIEPRFQIFPMQPDDVILLASVGITVSVLTGPLSRARTHLSIATAAAGWGTFEWNIKKNRVSWTPEMARLYGLKSAAFTTGPRGFLDRVHPDDLERVRAEIREAMSRRQSELIQEFRITLPEGETR